MTAPAVVTQQGGSDPFIRVLLVDDSAVVRGAIGRIIDATPDLRVVTTAVHGQQALDALKHTPVDVVLLDVEMPELDGLSALPLILGNYPNTRVVMASSLTQRGAAVTMQALAAGASDYISKPSARVGSAGLKDIEEEIVTKVRAIGRAAQRRIPVARPVVSTVSVTTPAATVAHAAILAAPNTRTVAPKIIAIASSTGGPNALAEVLQSLPTNLNIPVVITQHLPALFTGLLAQRLARDTGHDVVEARDNEPLRDGTVYIAPGGQHMLVATHEGKPFIRLSNAEPENFCRPGGGSDDAVGECHLRSRCAWCGAHGHG
jgi:two-component system chemotaxis response regulator CheB